MSESQIFNAAVRLHAGERKAFLTKACGGDAKLRSEVESLLAAHDRSIGFLNEPDVGEVAVTLDMPTVIARPGTRIGPYVLREQIGEGGFGVVFVAEQEQPVARKVAFKVIKPGMDSREIIARFEAERQALALMDHPHVAKVLDAGAMDSGRPYFVMELVHGISMTAFCDERNLSTHDRLRLFTDVCRAVQHAHQKAIIHRDLKPSNVLVTLDGDRPIAKVIDFGVSKALGTKLTEKTLYTAYGQMVGTPLYMSPEQAQFSAHDVDTRSDVYSLGVLLYELLTGTTPFDKETLKNAGFDEMRRIIREDEPPRPSARLSTLNAEALSTVSDKRKIDARKLGQSLRGELDWIVLKALEKDRNRRYESAAALAADVERYLSDEPVQARPASVGYRFGKFVRKNRTAAAIGSLAVLLLLALGFGGLAMVRQARDTAERERQTAADRIAVNREFNESLTLFQTALARAESGDPANERAWAAAQKAADRLKLLARDTLVDAASQDKCQSALTGLAKAEKDRTLELALSRLHMRHGHSIGISPSTSSVADREKILEDSGFAEAFEDYGLDIDVLSPKQFAETIRKFEPRVRAKIVVAIDEWHAYLRSLGPRKSHKPHQKFYERQQWTRDTLRLCDDDPWRKKLRRSLLLRDRNQSKRDKFRELQQWAESLELLKQPPRTWLALGGVLCARRLRSEFDYGVAFLKRAQRRFPADFAIAYWIGRHTWWRANMPFVKSERRIELARESVRYSSIAAALRPDDVKTGILLGDVLRLSGRPEESLATLRAIKSERIDDSGALSLASTYFRLRKYADSVHFARRAIKLTPDLFRAHDSLIRSLEASGRRREAIAVYRNLLSLPRLRLRGFEFGDPRLNKTLPVFLADAGSAEDKNQLLNLLRELERKYRDDEQLPHVHRCRGDLYFLRKDWKQAAESFDLAWSLASTKKYAFPLRVHPLNNADAVDFCLRHGQTLFFAGRYDDAIAAYRRVTGAYRTFAAKQIRKLAMRSALAIPPHRRDTKGAVKLAREAIRNSPAERQRLAKAVLAVALNLNGQFDEAFELANPIKYRKDGRPNLTSMWVVIAIHHRRGNTKLADDYYSRARRIRPIGRDFRRNLLTLRAHVEQQMGHQAKLVAVYKNLAMELRKAKDSEAFRWVDRRVRNMTGKQAIPPVVAPRPKSP